jgi:hypothetical protein
MALKKCFFTAILIFFATGSAFCQLGDEQPNYDVRIKNKLDSLGIKYTITESGNFKVVFNTKDGRTQLVLIYSKTNMYKGLEIREVKSVADKKENKADFSQEVLYNILEENQTYKVGAWQIFGGNAPYLLEFALRISANASQTILDDLIRLAAKVADEMELKLTGADEH